MHLGKNIIGFAWGMSEKEKSQENTINVLDTMLYPPSGQLISGTWKVIPARSFAISSRVNGLQVVGRNPDYLMV